MLVGDPLFYSPTISHKVFFSKSQNLSKAGTIWRMIESAGLVLLSPFFSKMSVMLPKIVSGHVIHQKNPEVII